MEYCFVFLWNTSYSHQHDDVAIVLVIDLMIVIIIRGIKIVETARGIAKKTKNRRHCRYASKVAVLCNTWNITHNYQAVII